MNLLFPPLEPDDMRSSAEPEGPIRTISDEGDWLPPNHKHYTEDTRLSDSLLKALRCFLLATAIRDFRAAQGADGGGAGIHRSMLVNVSRFTIVQNHVADALD